MRFRGTNEEPKSHETSPARLASTTISASQNTRTHNQKPGKLFAFHTFARLCILLLLAMMFATYVSNQAAMRWANPNGQKGQNDAQTNGGGTGWTGAGGPDSAAADAGSSGPSAASAHSALSTAYNYDKTGFDRLVSYRVAVAFQPKLRQHTNIFKRRAHGGAAPNSALSPSGEDNLFVSEQSADGCLALGVADGVGGWADAGYDSSAISRELCHLIKTGFEAADSKTTVSPRSLLASAFDGVQKSADVEIGGTTACLGVLTPDRKLKVANLGDSWCGLFRDHKLIEETRFQTHNFNTPYQLAKIPQRILHEAERQGKRYIIDSPDMCDEYEWDLQKDDVVIFATDGVTDNVVPQDIEVFLKDQAAQNKPLHETSAQLVKEVVKVSKDPNYPSAFAQELSKLTGQRYMGGKEDDITVVMVKVL
ncbi:hypothetical protein JCM33374_g1680 [Metschnikowia sp. JCM 33374]|nr:hypothetical protein JCM33374_g1680 [Metschnikowia sp. JCM 33374]